MVHARIPQCIMAIAVYCVNDVNQQGDGMRTRIPESQESFPITFRGFYH